MTRRHRRGSTSKTREIVEAYLNGEALHALSKQHDVCRILNRIWIEKYERREYDDDAVEADLLPGCEARIATAALYAATLARRPMPGRVFHKDRGSQNAAAAHRRVLKRHGFFGSMSRRGHPYDTAQAESFMRTLKVEAVYIGAYETLDDVAADLPKFIDTYDKAKRLHSGLGCLSPNQYGEKNAPDRSKEKPDLSSEWRPLQ